MGRTYTVPRSVRGESRILVIFTIKSFISTALVGIIGGLIWYVGGTYFNMGLAPGLIVTIIFGAIGYILGAAKIPDSPMVGKFRKAGGENLSDILLRFMTFKGRRKIFMYNIKRGGK